MGCLSHLHLFDGDSFLTFLSFLGFCLSYFFPFIYKCKYVPFHSELLLSGVLQGISLKYSVLAFNAHHELIRRVWCLREHIE